MLPEPTESAFQREIRYQRARLEPSDICEHVPTLRALASKADRVVEMGVRSGVSTTALLAGQPKSLHSIDVFHCPVVEDLKSIAGRTELTFRQCSSLEMEPEECDLLFIDTKHTYLQLREELDRHARLCVGKIAMHDTVLFGEMGDDGTTPGLRAAIEQFLQTNVGWSVELDDPKCCGLMVLTRE